MNGTAIITKDFVLRSSASFSPRFSRRSSSSLIRSSDFIRTPLTPSLRSTHPSIELLSNTNPFATSFLELLSRAREGLKYHNPELCEEGVNGTYFLKDKNGETIAVFKPQDEEGNSESNPKNKLLPTDETEALPTKGLFPGEAAAREVAAHLLDREHFYGVPKTQMVKVTHSFGTQQLISKTGSLQEFIENDGCSEDFGYKSFPVNEVHKIGILDIQTLNLDRHAGNILVKKSRNNIFSLIPIDHGFSSADNLECPWFEWMNWPQSRVPFDEETKSYIKRIDINKDLQMLHRELGYRIECLKTIKTTMTLLKKSIELDLTLYEIGSLLCRRVTPSPIPAPSVLEMICDKATQEKETLQVESILSCASISDSDLPSSSLSSSSDQLDSKDDSSPSSSSIDLLESDSIFFECLSRIVEEEVIRAKEFLK